MKPVADHVEVVEVFGSSKGDNLDCSFLFNSYTLSDISSIEEQVSSANSNDVSFSKNLLLTPMKGMGSEEELNFSIGFSKVMVDSDKSYSPDSFSSFAGTNFNH